MQAIVSGEYGPPEQLELREVDKPTLEDHQVLVRVHATSVNPAEWYRVTGPYFMRAFGGGLRKPKSGALGADLAGTIEAAGKDVTEFKPGDEVFGTSGASWAEYAAAREVRLVPKPVNVSFEEAAAVPVAALTALQALRNVSGVTAGQKVLINGASGGVGTYAVQLAKWLGADVTAVCSTRNVEQATALGADRVVDYSQQDFTRLGERHDVVIDIAGSRSLSQLKPILAPDGTVAIVGAKMSGKGLGPLGHVIRMKAGSLGRSQKAKFFITKIEKDDLALMAELLEAGTVKSVIDRRFEGLAQLPDALRYLGEGHARGKIVVTL